MTLLLLIKLLVKSQSLADHYQDPAIMTMLVPKQDLFNAQKVSSKREKKLSILLHSMKSMLSTAEPKAFWLYLQEILVKLSQKLENKLIRKLLNGEKKAELRSCQVYYLLMRYTCSILSAFHS